MQVPSYTAVKHDGAPKALGQLRHIDADASGLLDDDLSDARGILDVL